MSNYLYLQTIGTGTLNYLFDDSGKASYASVSDPMSSNLTWETVYTYNLGLDLSFLQNRLSFTGDFFIRDTKDMLTQSLTLPSVYGAATPTENCADLRTKGWELSITWRDQFKLGGKPFHYALTGQIGDYQTEITKYNNPTKLFDSYYEGKKLARSGATTCRNSSTPTRRPPPTRWRSTTVRTSTSASTTCRTIWAG